MATNEREQREQGSSRGMTRFRQGGEMSRRGFDPMGLSAGDFFGNPFALMRRMHDEMDRMMADAFGGRAGAGAMGGLGGWSPAVEVSEGENELNVCAELPGLKPEDVKVEVTDEALVIEGERKQEREEKQGGRWHSERSYGRFFRTIPLPEGANADQARADFKNGELRITIPVQRAGNKRRQIPIGGAASGNLSATQQNKGTSSGAQSGTQQNK